MLNLFNNIIITQITNLFFFASLVDIKQSKVEGAKSLITIYQKVVLVKKRNISPTETLHLKNKLGYDSTLSIHGGKMQCGLGWYWCKGMPVGLNVDIDHCLYEDRYWSL